METPVGENETSGELFDRLTELGARCLSETMKLFEEGYLYEARNLFSMVLQDNPEDMVVRYYIFRCG